MLFFGFQILPGLYIGDCRDARDTKQLEDNNISDILAVFDMARPIFAVNIYIILIIYFILCNLEMLLENNKIFTMLLTGLFFPYIAELCYSCLDDANCLLLCLIELMCKILGKKLFVYKS